MPNDKSKNNQSNDTGFLNIILTLPDDEKSFEGYTIAEQNGQSMIQKYPQLFIWAINQDQFHIEHNESMVLDQQYPIDYSLISKINNQSSNCEVITDKINLNTIQNTDQSFDYIDSINSKKSKKSNQSEKKQQVKPEDYIGTFFLQKFKNISSQKSRSQKTINISEDFPNKSPDNSQAQQSQFQQSFLLNQDEILPIASKFQKQQIHHFTPGILELALDRSQLSMNNDMNSQNPSIQQIKPDKDLIQQEYEKQNSKEYQEDGLDVVAQIFGSIKRTPSKKQLSINQMKINNDFAQNQSTQNRLDYEKRLNNGVQFLAQILGKINEDQSLQQEKIIPFSKVSENQSKSSNANTKQESQNSKIQKIKSQKNKQNQSISINSKNNKAHEQSKINTKSLSLNKAISESYYFGNNYKEESENNSSKSKQMVQYNKVAEQLIELKKRVSLLQKKINSQNQR